MFNMHNVLEIINIAGIYCVLIPTLYFCMHFFIYRACKNKKKLTAKLQGIINWLDVMCAILAVFVAWFFFDVYT